MAPLRRLGGARQRASPRLRSVAAPISRCAAQHTCGDRPAHSRGLRAPRPCGGLRPPLLALRASTSLLWRLCLQTSAALRRRASEWWSQRHSPFTPLLHGPPLGGAALQAPVPLPMERHSICIGPGGEPKALPLHAPPPWHTHLRRPVFASPPWAAPRGGLVGDSLTRKAGSSREAAPAPRPFLDVLKPSKTTV
jgi:hypothetical protein